VPGDARALVATDVNQDGWPDFFVTQNNGRALFFQNGGRAGARSFGVGLRGAAGNPAAEGARLTLTLANGATQLRDAGHGPAWFGYPEGNPPAKLKIRWPDGRVSEHTFAKPPAKLITISTP
jgi:enediyne biosynthesis protein E4